MKQKQTHRLTDIENSLVVAMGWGGGWRRDGLGVWGLQMQTITCRMDKQDPTVLHREH